MERRLAAILAADVVGYTRLMGADDAGTLQRLKEQREGLLEPLIATHHGRIVKLMGDGLLIEFASIVDGVTCAIAWQEKITEIEANHSEDTRLQYRIGVNLGDIIADNDDIYGDGVNVAARLEGLAEPGRVYVSGDAYRQVKGKIDALFEDQGEQELKNVVEPVRVYRIATDRSPAGVTSLGTKTLALPDKPSIAVLPFDNLSGDPDQEYFADGVVEDIITSLSKFRWFFVVARNTTFTYKRQAVAIVQVARDLGVQYVLEGSVRRSGSRVRINAQLIDALTESHIWAERYDRELDDIFDVQDEITATIIGAIEPELGNAERARAKRNPPNSLDAWDSYQRGLWHYWRREKDDTEAAQKLFEGTIELDPGFSSAYSGLAEVCYIKLYHGWTATPDETFSLGLRAGQQAVALDDKDAFAHFALGRIHLFEGQFETAIFELQTALDLNPNLAIAHYGLGIAFLWSGQAHESLPHAHKAIRQSPNDPLMHGFEALAGAAQFQLGKYAEAVQWCRKASRHPSCSFWTFTHLATALVKLDQLEDARAAIREARARQLELSLTSVSLILERMQPEYRLRILDCLRTADLPN